MMTSKANPYQDDTPEPLFNAAYLQRAIAEAATTRTPRRWLAKYGGVIPDPRAPLVLRQQFRQVREQVAAQIPRLTPSGEW